MIKKIILLFLLFITLLSSNNVFSSNDYNNNIEQAELIEKYILQVKNEVNELSIKYESNDSEFLKEKFKEMDNLVYVLRKIKDWEFQNNNTEDIIKKIFERFKELNSELIVYLKERKQFKIEKDFYIEIEQKVSNKITILLDKMNLVFKQKTNLSTKEKEILKHLENLEELNKYLKIIEKTRFDNSEEIRESLVKIIKEVKIEIDLIKKIISEQ